MTLSLFGEASLDIANSHNSRNVTADSKLTNKKLVERLEERVERPCSIS